MSGRVDVFVSGWAVRRLAILAALLGGCQTASEKTAPIQESAPVAGQPVGAAIETLGIT